MIPHLKTALLSLLIVTSAILLALGTSVGAAASPAVVFIADGATGDGTSADSPLKPTVGHYDVNETIPALYKDSALYQAAKKLELTGGTIVICGPVTLDASNTCGNDDTFRDFFMPSHGKRMITITSFYNGIDYRESNGARLILKSPATLSCSGFTVFKNIDICTQSADMEHPATKRIIAANGNDLYLDVGIRTFVLDHYGKTFTNPIPACYPTLVGGSRSQSTEGEHHLVIKSGTYYQAAVGSFGTGDSGSSLHTGSGTLTIYGGVFRGCVSGTSLDAPTVSGMGGGFAGDSAIEINGGLFYGPILSCSPRGYSSPTSTFSLTIRGGLFKQEGIKFFASSENGVVNEYAPSSASIRFDGYDPEAYDASNLESSYCLHSENKSIGFHSDHSLDQRVIFIADNGRGDGSSPDKPLRAIVREKSDSSLRYRNSVLYQAAELLADSGGTIVIVGEVKLDERYGNGTSKSTQDFCMPATKSPITITSLYNGVNYRTNGSNARLILQNPITLSLGGETIFENLNIFTMPWTYSEGGSKKTVQSSRLIAADCHKMTFGEGISCGVLTEDGKNDPSAGMIYYPTLAGGHRYKSTQGDTDLTVLSGKFYAICAGNHGINTAGYGASNGTLNLTVGGNTTVETLYGTCLTDNESAAHTGDININITGGMITGHVYTVGKGGLTSPDSRITLTVSGKAKLTASENKSIFHIIDGHKNDAPQQVTVDLSQYSGTAEQVRKLYNKISGASDIITPMTAVTAIALKNAPTKTLFYAGDFYKPIGLQLTATVFDDIQKTIAYSPSDGGFTFSAGQSSPLSADVTSVQVCYNGQDCGTFDITVKPDRPIHALGAMIKTDTESQGLRFIGKVMKNTGFDLSECSYGFLVLPSSMLDETDTLSFDHMAGMVTLDAAGYELRSEPNDARHSADDNTDSHLIFSATLDDIALQDYKTAYTAVAYLCYEENGETQYIYSEPIERSVYGVALAACGSGRESSGKTAWLQHNVIDKADAGLDGTYDAVAAYRNGNAILNYMEAMASVEWTPSAKIDLSSHSTVSDSCIYLPKQTYRGLPYCAGIGDLENFSAELTDGIYQTPAAVTTSNIRGNVCSTAPLAGWIRYGNDIIGIRKTDDMNPAQNTGFYAVGEYNWRGYSHALTEEILLASGDNEKDSCQTLYRALAQVNIGDALISRWASGSNILGHVRLVAAPPHVAYNFDGSINAARSTLKLTEQTSSLKQYNGYSSNWLIEKEYTFAQLISTNTTSYKYIPIATKEFTTGYFPKNFCVIKDINSASDVTEGLKGTIVSNYDVCSVRIDIKNAATGAVVKTAAEYYNFVRRINLSTLMSSSDFASLAKGSYRLIVTADVNAQNKVLLDLPFTK